MGQTLRCSNHKATPAEVFNQVSLLSVVLERLVFSQAQVMSCSLVLVDRNKPEYIESHLSHKHWNVSSVCPRQKPAAPALSETFAASLRLCGEK